MRSTETATRLLLAVLVLLGSSLAAQHDLRRTLQDGSVVRIDPGTGKAWVTTPRGAQAMLWDGVHKLRDGTTMIVRGGVVVPDKPIIGARRGASEPLPGTRVSPCGALEQKVCGKAGECGDTEPCRLARELVQFEDQDREAGRPDAVERTLQQCRQALDETEPFPECARADPLPETTASAACATLAEQVCGTRDQCADSPPCRAAHQLIALERDERLAHPAPEVRLKTTGQCREAASDSGFFAPCPD
jgi:hypothetical protein